jgi:hypothetical protein
MRPLLILAVALLASCEQPAPPTPRDATKEPWYRETVDQLTAMNREANSAFAGGKPDQAAALIEKGEPLVARLLTTPNPTLEAAIAASDLDDLYGRMLLSNRHYGDARLLFQKNLARWRHWQPQTSETARLLKRAESAIAECDKHIVE